MNVGASNIFEGLRPIAYDGTRETDKAPILLKDLDAAVLAEIPIPPLVGNLITDGVGGIGADQLGYVASITIDGTTYTYNPTENAVDFSGGIDNGMYNTLTRSLSVTTGSGATFLISLSTGGYSYQALSTTEEINETLTFSLSDYDGDQTDVQTLTIQISQAPNARDDRIVTNISDSEASITILENCLLANDDVHGASLTETSNVTSGSLSLDSGKLIFTDDNADGGSLFYTLSGPTGSVSAKVTINRTQAEEDTLDGTEFGEILIGQNSATTLLGLEGDDILIGGIADDVLDGGAGDDIMTGCAGSDTFAWVGTLSSQHDVITDFTTGTEADSDRVLIDAALTGLSTDPDAAELGAYLMFTISGSNTVLTIDANGPAGEPHADTVITFADTDLYSQYGVDPDSATANMELVNHMLDQGNLMVIV